MCRKQLRLQTCKPYRVKELQTFFCKDFRTQAVRLRSSRIFVTQWPKKEPTTRKGSNKKHLKAYTTPFRGRFAVGVFVVINIWPFQGQFIYRIFEATNIWPFQGQEMCRKHLRLQIYTPFRGKHRTKPCISKSFPNASGSTAEQSHICNPTT